MRSVVCTCTATSWLVIQTLSGLPKANGDLAKVYVVSNRNKRWMVARSRSRPGTVSATMTLSPGNEEWAYAGIRGRLEMTHSNLTVEVQGNHILVVLRGTCFRAKYRKQDAPWLALEEHGPDDPGAAITFSEFRSLAWAAANEAAHQLGWIKSCDELHRAAKRVGSSLEHRSTV